MRTRFLVLAAIAGFSFGCAQSPVGVHNDERRPATARPHFDGGVMYGSGNRDGGGTNATAGTDSAAVTLSESGVMYGSGN